MVMQNNKLVKVCLHKFLQKHFGRENVKKRLNKFLQKLKLGYANLEKLSHVRFLAF